MCQLRGGEQRAESKGQRALCWDHVRIRELETHFVEDTPPLIIIRDRSAGDTSATQHGGLEKRCARYGSLMNICIGVTESRCIGETFTRY
jgi:hypothetical protein